MNPVAFSIFGLEIRWYGIFIALGMLVASQLLVYFAKKRGISADTVYDLVLVVIPAALIGARLYYVIFSWDYYQGDVLKMLDFRSGGLAIHGGVIAGLLAGYIFCRVKKLPFLALADMVAPGLILAQAIGRWGNFMNNEAHGGPTDLPWGIAIPGLVGKYHPTFLYESIWDLLVFALLLYIIRRVHRDGEVILSYGIFYSIGRFFIEGLRTDSLMLGPLRVAQVVSLATILICLILLWWVRKTPPKPQPEERKTEEIEENVQKPL